MKACILGIAGPELLHDEAALLAAGAPAGIMLFGRNVRDPAQLASLTAALRRVLPANAVLMVDQEGGCVARLKPPHWTAHPPVRAIGALHAANPDAGHRAAWLTGALIGLDCAAAGFDVVTAPVLDRSIPGANDVIGNRAFAADPHSVATLAAAFAAGLLAAGIQPVGKHAPGHGRATADSHQTLPELDDISDADLAPFIANATLPWMMTAHIRYRALDEHPATLSPTIISEVIRRRIGFDGVLISDDLAMHALSGTPANRARAALAAGCDIALYCPGDAANHAVLDAVPDLTATAVARLDRARGAPRKLPLQKKELQMEREQLLKATSNKASDPTA